jgi:hypothetical protein
MTPDEIRALSAEDGDRLADYAERARVGDWTLRSALVRHAQSSPVAASAVLELVRRTDHALHPHRRDLERAPVAEVDAAADGSPSVVDLLGVADILDRMGDVLAAWARDRAPADPPAAEVDALAAEAFARLGELGVPRETRPPRRAG